MSPIVQILIVNQHGCLRVFEIKCGGPLNYTVINYHQRDNDLQTRVPCNHEYLFLCFTELQTDDLPLEGTDMLPLNSPIVYLITNDAESILDFRIYRL